MALTFQTITSWCWSHPSKWNSINSWAQRDLEKNINGAPSIHAQSIHVFFFFFYFILNVINFQNLGEFFLIFNLYVNIFILTK